MSVEVAWCEEHENPTVSGAAYCPFVFWLELKFAAEIAEEAADECRIVPAMLTKITEEERIRLMAYRDTVAKSYPRVEYVNGHGETLTIDEDCILTHNDAPGMAVNLRGWRIPQFGGMILSWDEIAFVATHMAKLAEEAE